MKEFKQNIIYELQGNKIKLQFEFCPRCKLFKDCYSDGFAHYISQECIDDFRNEIFVDHNEGLTNILNIVRKDDINYVGIRI